MDTTAKSIPTYKSYHVSFKDVDYLAHYQKTIQGGVIDCMKYTEEAIEDGVILRLD